MVLEGLEELVVRAALVGREVLAERVVSGVLVARVV